MARQPTPVQAQQSTLVQAVSAVGSPSASRPVWVEIDLAAVRHNAGVLAAAAAPAALCAVVKADGYGHGAVPVAAAALEGGAAWLAVATVDEGIALRHGGIAAPVLVLSEPVPSAMAPAWQAGLTPTLYSLEGVAAARAAVGANPRGGSSTAPSMSTPGAAPGPEDGVGPWSVQVKVDTGMHRVGADPEDVAAVVSAVDDSPELALGGVWTHLAVADGGSPEDRVFTARQLRRFDRTVEEVGLADRPEVLRHAANSAGTLAHPDARYDLVRCGIALYGLPPSDDLVAVAERIDLRPVLTWRAQVSHVRLLPAGARPSYGRLRPLPTPAAVATVPVGYADGVQRRYFDSGGTVLIGGRHRPLAGMVTMDQIVVDCGPDRPEIGDPVVLIGDQGSAHLGAADWARTLGTISYEVLCGIGPRVPRVVVDRERRPSGAIDADQVRNGEARRGEAGAVQAPTGEAAAVAAHTGEAGAGRAGILQPGTACAGTAREGE